MQVSRYREVLSLWSKREGSVMSFEFECRPQSDQQFEEEKEEKNNVNDIEKIPEASNIPW